MVNPVFFYLISLAIISTAIYAVSSSKLLNAALSLALSFFSIGMLYFMLGTPFMGMLQFLINAGAIPIVTVFIIFMTQSRVLKLKSPATAVTAIAAMVMLAIGFAVYMSRSGSSLNAQNVTPVSGAMLGEKLLGSMETTGKVGTLFAFEIASVLLLVAMVGAIILTKREGETIKGNVGVLSEVEKSVTQGELETPARAADAVARPAADAVIPEAREKVTA
jgi:NADH-quinone oxidoreductase subunit J